VGRRREHGHRLGADDSGRRLRRGAPLLPGEGDLLRRFGFGAGSGEIHTLLGEAGEKVVAVARAVEQRFLEWPSGPTQETVKELEHEADAVVSALLTQANAMFVTPYDREDIVKLAFTIDDVADAAENAAELLGLYGVETPTKQSFQLCALLVRAAEELAALLGELRTVSGDSDRIRAIKEIEDEADDVARAARASLFKDERIDPVIVIRWKDVYEALEDAVDRCDTAATRIGNILVKNA
jgi:predicted phosphate transport protein (TIGR00153 family)